MKRQTSLYFIVIGAFLLFISGSFLSEGLSRVGMDNAVVSQRMAEGFEDFWLPSMSSPGNPDRMNYLPLGYWIESQWYHLFGNDSFMAEKVYSVMTYFILAALMIWIWGLIGNNKRTGWLPLMCWITIPIVTWSATNNLLESTMTMFILLSVAFMLKGGRASFIAQSRLALGKKTGPYRLSLNSIHKVNSNDELLEDMKLILPCLNEGEVLSASKEVLQSSEVAEYFYRYKKITFDSTCSHRHLLTMYSLADGCGDSVQFVRTDLPTRTYILYEKGTVLPEPDTAASNDTIMYNTIENEENL